MLKFSCKDVGVDCDFIATGATFEEVKQKALDHAGIVHAALMKGMNASELAQLSSAVSASIKET